MSLQEDLGRTIIRLRKEKGYSQEAFANEAGIGVDLFVNILS